MGTWRELGLAIIQLLLKLAEAAIEQQGDGRPGAAGGGGAPP